MNRFVRNKIIKDNLPLFGIGAVCTFGGLFLNAIIYEAGWIISILIAIPLIGVMLFFSSLFHIIYWPANAIYKCWKYYGSNDSIIEEIKKAINKKKKELESEEVIISNGWIIKPKEFIFVKPKDVNWIYLSRQGPGGSGNYNQKIKIFTTFGLSFDVKCAIIHLKNKDENLVTEDVSIYLDVLSHFCKNAIIGYRPEFRIMWKKDPKRFVEKAKKYIEKNQ